MGVAASSHSHFEDMRRAANGEGLNAEVQLAHAAIEILKHPHSTFRHTPPGGRALNAWEGFSNFLNHTAPAPLALNSLMKEACLQLLNHPTVEGLQNLKFCMEKSRQVAWYHGAEDSEAKRYLGDSYFDALSQILTNGQEALDLKLTLFDDAKPHTDQGWKILHDSPIRHQVLRILIAEAEAAPDDLTHAQKIRLIMERVAHDAGGPDSAILKELAIRKTLPLSDSVRFFKAAFQRD